MAEPHADPLDHHGKDRDGAVVMWQLNEDTLGLYFNESVGAADTDGVYEFDVRSDSPSLTYAIGIDVKDGENHWRRIFPRASLNSTGDQQLQKERWSRST